MLRLAGVFVSLGLFCLACMLPAGYGQGGFMEDGIELTGWKLLLFGWLMLRFSVLAYLAWLGNLLWILALGCLWRRNYRGTLIASALGAVLSLVPVLLMGDPLYLTVRLSPPIALLSASGNLELRAGYIAWMASHFALLIAGSLLFRLHPTNCTPHGDACHGLSGNR